MAQEFRRRRVGQRASGNLAPSRGANPARLHQHVERAFRYLDAANRFDFGARHRLVIGDDRQRLDAGAGELARRSEEHTSELQSLMRNSYAVFCLKKKKTQKSSAIPYRAIILT